jgi:phenylalanyl-tRNA synthetase beta chain
MKFTLSWLKQHLDTDAKLDEITDTLTKIGLELEGVDDPAATLGGFRIAEVIEAVQHPNADRLRACRVDTGEGIVSVVCGAPNARTGMKAVFARPGSFIPGTGITLQVGQIRGVESAGMLLSLREMGLGDDHTGIVDLPAEAPVGVPYVQWAGMDDPVIEIAVTPNRGDALSVRGVARDLAAAGIGALRPFAPASVPASYASPLQWRIEFSEYCPWVLGRAVRGVRNGPSPDWLVRRLTSIGLRPINALVDITNFFTFDLGRPLHVFDVGKVQGGSLTFRHGSGETLLGLHGREVTLTSEDCAIADEAGAQSLAGVVGGEATGCDENTTEVFVECALFDPVRVALSGRRHAVSSDARQRFERGIDPALMPAAVEAATAMIIELCGGEASETVAAGAEPAWQREATLRFERLLSFGGLAVPADEAVARLERLGFGVAARDALRVTVSVPSWRNDIAQRSPLEPSPDLAAEMVAKVEAGRAEIEPEADLIEEVLRLGGLDAVPPLSMPGIAPIPSATLTPAQSRAALARRVMASRGLAECVTFSFMRRERAALFGDAQALLGVDNPISADLDTMRPTPLATLAEAAARNAARGEASALLFEVGPAFHPELANRQRLVAAGLRAGTTPRHWAEPSRSYDAMDAKGDLWALLAALGVPLEALTVAADAPAYFHPGRSGTVRQGPKTVLGYFGVLHPRLCAALDLPQAAGFALDLDAIAEPKRRKRAAPDLPALQPVRRDFAFLVDATVPAETLLRAARGAERNLIAGVALFDRYERTNVPEGKVSLAIEVTLQPREKTLTEAEIEAAAAKVVAAVGKATGAVLRG